MTPLTIDTLSQIRASLPRRSECIKGVDYVMKWLRAEQLRQEMAEISEFEILLHEEMRRGL